jgi:cell division transport system permease protein
MLDHIEFLLSEAFMAIRRNFLMSFAAISTAAVALFLLGGLGYVYMRLNTFTTEVSKKFEMKVWLKDHIDEARSLSVADKLKAIPGVSQVTFVSKDVEWGRWKIQEPELTQGWDENILPNSYKVKITEVSDAKEIAKQIYKIAEVRKDGVTYLAEEQQLIDQVLSISRWMGGAIGSLLLLTAGILIYNAIRLTIFARRREIRIMQLVGSSNQTIQIPFLIEGTVHGVVGGLFAAVLIGLAQAALEGLISQIIVGSKFPPYPFGLMVTALMLVGGLFGLACSYIAIREPLRYRSGVVI